MLTFLFSHEGLRLAQSDKHKWREEYAVALELYRLKKTDKQWGKDIFLIPPSKLPENIFSLDILTFLLSFLEGHPLTVELQRIISKSKSMIAIMNCLIENNSIQELKLILDKKIIILPKLRRLTQDDIRYGLINAIILKE